jgi:hypothetical protein
VDPRIGAIGLRRCMCAMDPFPVLVLASPTIADQNFGIETLYTVTHETLAFLNFVMLKFSGCPDEHYN